MEIWAPTAALAEAPPAVCAPTFEDLYKDHFAFVWRSARGLGVSEASLDDVVQEIFVVAHRRLGHFEGRSSLRTWLSGIVLNVVRHHRRTTRRKSPHELDTEASLDLERLEATGPAPDEALTEREQSCLLERLLAEVDEKKREVLVLAELEELSVPEIGEVLGVNVNTVYSRLRLAREEFERVAARYRARDARRPR